MPCAHLKVIEQLCGVDSLLFAFIWVPEIKLKSPGLHGKFFTKEAILSVLKSYKEGINELMQGRKERINE